MTRLVFLFPGQGSQHPGMGHDLYCSLPAVRSFVDQMSESTEVDVADLMFRSDARRLSEPEAAHLSIYALSMGLLAHLSEIGVEPWAVAGHSLGEYGALVAAGCITWDEGLGLVSRRGHVISRASAEVPGLMAGIVGLPANLVEQLCGMAAGVGRVVVANYNSPVQTVVSGEAAAVENVVALAKESGAIRATLLDVGGAFHSPLMEPAAKAFLPSLEDIELGRPRTVMVSGITGKPVSDVDEYSLLLRSQITSPVQWSTAVRTLIVMERKRSWRLGRGAF